MLYSELFLPTVREIPADAEVLSHQLMLRAGMIRKLTGGVYSFLPLGLRVIRKVEKIVREEMNRAGAQEVLLPAIQPAEIWEESGRWQLYGKELFRFKDRHNRECCIGPTHEEVITDLVRHEIKTYRQLPKNLYQIQTKFRDEIRPRFGIMRCREFGMKDAYSFDADMQGADISYQKMYEAYMRIFARCGLNFRAVEADTGNIGGSSSHEFMVMADSGEDAVAFCTSCDYAANLEKAEIVLSKTTTEKEASSLLPLSEIHTPNVRSIQEVCSFLNATPDLVIKTMIYQADQNVVAVLVKGEHEINEAKLKNYLKADNLELATDDVILKATGAPKGFAGPIGIKVRTIADQSLAGMANVIVGANKEDYHVMNANCGRDFQVSDYADLRFITEADVCPRCQSEIKFARGIEVGHVFKLGTKYSKAMHAVYLDKSGQEQLMIMGCYGIGIGRTVAAGIEQNYDENGIVWPMPIAPYHVIITPVNIADEKQAAAARDLYEKLQAQGIEVLFDDRDERAGVKFNDADLIGIPIRVTIGPKRLAEGKVEIKLRRGGEVKIMDFEETPNFITSTVQQETGCRC